MGKTERDYNAIRDMDMRKSAADPVLFLAGHIANVLRGDGELLG